MKTWTAIIKILAALAAVAGVVYVIATYGDKIVAFAKKLLGCNPCDDCDCEECDCEECECFDDECEEALEEIEEIAETADEEETVVADEEEFEN